MEDKHLVISAKNGDSQAFAVLYGRYKDRLYRYAYYKLGSKEDAQDAVSDCILSAYRQISEIKRAESFTAWIFRILYCCCNEIIKQRINSRQSDSFDDMENMLTANTENTIEKTIEKTELQQALAILSDDEREIVLLSVVAGFTSKEIAGTCDLTAGSVRSKLSRSLKKMREFLE